MTPTTLIAALILTAAASWAATAGVLRLLRSWQVFDQPNHRSSHHNCFGCRCYNPSYNYRYCSNCYCRSSYCRLRSQR